MASLLMQLKIVLPTAVFAEIQAVKRIVVETPAGAFGLLPRRLDCVSAVIPGILTYETDDGVEGFIAVDNGILVKHDQHVLVAVQRAFAGQDLARLQQQLNQQLLQQGDEEQNQRRLQTRLETGFLRRFASFQHE